MIRVDMPSRRGDVRLVLPNIWAVTLPILFASVGETVIHATATAFLAHVGTTELGAIAYADTLFEICTVPAVGLASAMQIMIARRLGEQRDRAVGVVYAGGMVLVLVASLVVAVGVMLASPSLSQMLTGSADTAREVDNFLQIAAYGLLFYTLNLAYGALYVGLGQTRVLVSATVLVTAANLLLSYALILGNLGLPRLGIRGAAISFVGAEALTFLYLTVRVLTGQLTHQYRVLREQEQRPLGLLLRLACPISLKALLERLRWLLFFVILGQVGEDVVAWSNLLFSIFALLLIPTYAFAETTDALVSNAIGQGGLDLLRRLVRRLTKAVYTLTLPFVVLVMLVPQVVLSVFTSEPDALHGAAPSLRVVALVLMVAVPAEIWLAALVGTGDTYTAFGVDLLLSLIFVGGAYLLAIPLELPLPYVWLSPLLASLISWMLSSWWVRTGRWQEHQLY